MVRTERVGWWTRGSSRRARTCSARASSCARHEERSTCRAYGGRVSRRSKEDGRHRGKVRRVLGPGPIGLAILLCLKGSGTAWVAAVEPSHSRAQLASLLGPDHVIV